MALINCSECGKEISDQAVACPSCAYPLQPQHEEPKPVPQKRRSLLPGPLLVLFFLSIITLARQEKDHKSPVSSQAAPSSSATTSTANSAIQSETWRTDLSIVKTRWSISEFSVATWQLTIKNASRKNAYKDIHFKTTYWAKSGTKVDESLFGHTEYINIYPGQTVQIKFTEFTHSQARSATIEIASAVRW
jgi:hypothetical protein